MMIFIRYLSALLVLSILTVSAASADDWLAAKLRGQVVQLVDSKWVPLQRGDIVPDSRYVRTLNSGNVVFTRGGETVALLSNTQIRIFDEAGSKPFTTVQQSYGAVSIEANVEKVQHFAVQTPYLAAVVKGTRFTVRSGKSGSTVEVQRGHVEVEDSSNHTQTTISVGQSAQVDKQATAGTIIVSGSGSLPPVLDKHGKPVEEAKKLANETGKIAKDAAKQAEKLAKDQAKSADKVANDMAKSAEKASNDAEKTVKDAGKEADKATKDAAKETEKAAKDAEKAVKDALKN